MEDELPTNGHRRVSALLHKLARLRQCPYMTHMASFDALLKSTGLAENTVALGKHAESHSATAAQDKAHQWRHQRQRAAEFLPAAGHVHAGERTSREPVKLHDLPACTHLQRAAQRNSMASL